MNAHTFVRVEAEQPTPVPVQSSSLVFITSVSGTLQHPHTGLCGEARGAFDALAEHGVPVVLWSDACAADVMEMQSALRVPQPFICEEGAELYVPSHYFREPIGLGRDQGPWTVIDCSRPFRSSGGDIAEAAQAIRLLIGLYRVFWDDVLVVGVGSEWRDRDLLHEVDVPVVVRRHDCDQHRLVRRFPDAYVTRATGPAGWCEAILGAREEA
jgi:predicted mannosyl-3-phosphoglycerate phosphatase (HAD superfamily)